MSQHGPMWLSDSAESVGEHLHLGLNKGKMIKIAKKGIWSRMENVLIETKSLTEY
jgi:hypothetical protein